jgi:predicted AAA+ superfamily ATPase
MTALEELYIANISYRCSIGDHRTHSAYKKIYVLDPFIFHALHGWANAKKDYFANARANTLDLAMKSKMVEAVVYNHLCRFAYNLNPRDLFDPKDMICYYKDKSEKEIDFVLLFDGRYYPFEVKYQATIATEDFFPFKAFGKGVLITKDHLDVYRNYVQIPITIFLLLI